MPANIGKLYGLQDSTKHLIQYKTTKVMAVSTGKIVISRVVIGRYDHRYDSTADSARALAGFATRPTELNPYVAEWGTVKDARGKFVCISFPYGALGQNGHFQEVSLRQC